MAEGTTIVHAAGDAAGEVAAPVVDLAEKAGEAAAHIEHHGEQIADHAEQIAEQDDKWENLTGRVERLETQLLEIPAQTGATVTTALETFKRDVEEMVKSSTSIPENIANGSEETAPPEPTENKAEKRSFLGGVRDALVRLL